MRKTQAVIRGHTEELLVAGPATADSTRSTQNNEGISRGEFSDAPH